MLLYLLNEVVMRNNAWIALAMVGIIIAIAVSGAGATIALLNSTVSTGTTASPSGLELITVSGDEELSMLRGCADAQILKFVNSTGAWTCQDDSTTAVTGAGAVIFDPDALNCDTTNNDLIETVCLDTTYSATITITGAAVQLIIGGGAALVLSDLDCSGFANGGTLSTTGSGVVGCFDDDSGSGGSAIVLDLGDDGGNDSTDLTEIATTGCTGGTFSETYTEPTDDKLLITCNQVDFGDLSGSAIDSQIPDTITINLAATATALAANPGDCSTGPPQLFAHIIAASGNLTCTQVAFSDLSGSAVDSQIPDDITITLAATATALASNPADCGADTKADAIAANGDLTCTAVDTGDITDNTILPTDLNGNASFADEECITFEATGNTFEGQACDLISLSNSFETMDVPAGTDPVASSPNDTLTWTSTGSTITITGDSGTDTINLEAVDVTCTGCLGTTEIAGLDISDDTNLTCGRSLTTSGDGCDADAELFTIKKSITLLDPTTGDTNKVQFEYATTVTITEVSCSVDAGSVTIQFDERARATPNTAGTDVMTSTLVCDTDSETTTTFDNAGIAADVPVNLQITDVTTAIVVRIHIKATKDD